MQKLLAGTIDQDLVNALFGPERVLQFEANAELDLVSQYLNARYTPASANLILRGQWMSECDSVAQIPWVVSRI